MNRIKGSERKIATGMIALLMVTAMFGACIYSDEEETDDSDAFVITATILVAAVIASYIAGVGTGFYFDHGDLSDSDNSDTSRTNEAATISEETGLASAFYNNALTNYAQLWGLTDEHWIRAAELAAAYRWSADSSYDTESILTSSEQYYNSGYMMINATEQMNCYFDSLSERVAAWSDYNTYNNGQMTLNWSYGTHTFGSDTDWNGYATTAVVLPSGEDDDTVYIGGGNIYVFGGSATITATDGTAYTLSEGKNDLDSVTGFESGYYALQDNRQYAGTEIVPVVADADAADVHAAIVMEADGEYKLAYYDNNYVHIDGGLYSDLSISCVPSSGTSSSQSIKTMFQKYEGMLDAMYDSLDTANSSAHAVWDIYDECGSACEYLTTLSIPDFYENVELSTSMKTVMTTLTLTELSQYAQDNDGELKTSGYDISDGSLSLYCRGSIYYYSGTEKVTLYDDVIFTPFLYQDDMTLTLGEQELDQYGIVAVWADGESISTWDHSTDEASVMSVTSGYYFDISEMYSEGVSVSTMDLDISEIDYIAGTTIPTNPITPLTSGSDDTNWIQIALIIIGILLIAGAVIAAMRGAGDLAWKMAVLGVALCAIGYFEPAIVSLYDGITSIGSLWPFITGGS